MPRCRCNSDPFSDGQFTGRDFNQYPGRQNYAGRESFPNSGGRPNMRPGRYFEPETRVHRDEADSSSPGTNDMEIIVAYGGLYNTVPQIIECTDPDVPVQVNLALTMPGHNVTYPRIAAGTPAANSLEVHCGGRYEITYSICVTAAADTELTLSVRRCDAVQASTTVTRSLLANMEGAIGGSAIISLADNDTVDLIVTVHSSTAITFGTDVSASLIVKKLNV